MCAAARTADRRETAVRIVYAKKVPDARCAERAPSAAMAMVMAALLLLIADTDACNFSFVSYTWG